MSYLQCQFQELICEREGMIAENKKRESEGKALAYGELEFRVVGEQFSRLGLEFLSVNQGS